MALSKYESLIDDPKKEEEYDRLAELAGQFCDIPIAFINLIGEDKEFKKACYGFEGQTTARTESFCKYTIMQDDVLEIRDSLEHELFKKDPALPGPDKLRF